jgi:hypothetical protein
MEKTLKLRGYQSFPLTISEMDNNLLYLKELAESSSNEASEQDVEVYLPLLDSTDYENLLLGTVSLLVKGLYNKDDEGDYERISFSGLVKLDEVFDFYTDFSYPENNTFSDILENLENDFYLPVNYTLIKKDESDVYISINSTLIDYEYYYDGIIHDISYKILNDEKIYEKYDSNGNSLEYSKRGYIDSTYEINFGEFPADTDSTESFIPVGGDNYGDLYVTKKSSFFELVIKNQFDKSGLENIDFQISSIIVTKNSSIGESMPIYSYKDGVIFIKDAEDLIINIKGYINNQTSS